MCPACQRDGHALGSRFTFHILLLGEDVLTREYADRHADRISQTLFGKRA